MPDYSNLYPRTVPLSDKHGIRTLPAASSFPMSMNVLASDARLRLLRGDCFVQVDNAGNDNDAVVRV
jgi:hypothetical protein